MTSDADTLAEIAAILMNEGVGDAPIAKADVMRWMASKDMEVLSAVYDLIMERRFSLRIDPYLEFREYLDFLKNYYGRCIKEDPEMAKPESQWLPQRHIAAYELHNFIKLSWDAGDVEEKYFVELKEWIADLYKEGDDGVRECLINGTLEHLFEHQKIAAFFKDWKKDELLGQAYADAMLWATHQPTRSDKV